jgi:hypothetical protein
MSPDATTQGLAAHEPIGQKAAQAGGRAVGIRVMERGVVVKDFHPGIPPILDTREVSCLLQRPVEPSSSTHSIFSRKANPNKYGEIVAFSNPDYAHIQINILRRLILHE